MTDNRITQRMVDRLEPPAKGNKVVYDRGDKAVRGFGIRITAAGAKSFVINYRNADGQERRLTIGSPPDWSVEAARKYAGELKRRIREAGEDPLAEKRARLEAPTMSELAAEYLRDHAPDKRERSRKEDEAMIRQFVDGSFLGNLKVAAVKSTDIKKLHRSISVETPIRANRVLALLSKMFSLATNPEIGYRVDNPASGKVVKRNPENQRKQYLRLEEMQALVKSLSVYPNRTPANAVLLLLLTGARRGEVIAATWGQFDLKAGLWTKPAAFTKQKKDHQLPLSSAAMVVLEEQAKAWKHKNSGKEPGPSDYVFPGQKPSQPIKELQTVWTEIAQAAGLGALAPRLGANGKPLVDAKGAPKMEWKCSTRLHDLRHSHASILVSKGKTLAVIGEMLGHTRTQTTARYAHLFDDARRDAAETVGGLITALKEGNVPAEVIQLKRGS